MSKFRVKSSSKPAGKLKREQQAVDLAKLPDKVGLAADFLSEHVKNVKGRVSTKGNQIQVEGLKHREVKLLLHKFLRHNALNDYRVLSQSGTLEIVLQHVATHTRSEGGTSPPATSTLPYLFPGTPAPAVPEKKRGKKS